MVHCTGSCWENAASVAVVVVVVAPAVEGGAKDILLVSCWVDRFADLSILVRSNSNDVSLSPPLSSCSNKNNNGLIQEQQEQSLLSPSF